MSGYGASRFDAVNAFGSNYTTPGWQRAQARKARGDVGGFDENGQRRYVPDGVLTTDTRMDTSPALRRRLRRASAPCPP